MSFTGSSVASRHANVRYSQIKSLYLVSFVDLVFLLGLSKGTCLRSVSRSDPGCRDLCLLSYSDVSLFALGCSRPFRDSLDLSAGTASPLGPAKDLLWTGPVQMHHRCQNHHTAVIPYNYF